jgi:hypothetical protein
MAMFPLEASRSLGVLRTVVLANNEVGPHLLKVELKIEDFPGRDLSEASALVVHRFKAAAFKSRLSLSTLSASTAKRSRLSYWARSALLPHVKIYSKADSLPHIRIYSKS